MTQQEWWKNQVEAATRNVARQEYTNSLMAELEAMINPPQTPPEPEPQVVYVEENDDKNRPVEVHRWFTR